MSTSLNSREKQIKPPMRYQLTPVWMATDRHSEKHHRPEKVWRKGTHLLVCWERKSQTAALQDRMGDPPTVNKSEIRRLQIPHTHTPASISILTKGRYSDILEGNTGRTWFHINRSKCFSGSNALFNTG